jgi:hypothetical protein
MSRDVGAPNPAGPVGLDPKRCAEEGGPIRDQPTLLQRLSRDLSRSERALIARGRADAAVLPALLEGLRGIGLSEADIELCLWTDDPQSRETVTGLNAERDLLLARRRLVLLVSPTEEGLRDLHRQAPDLLSRVDLSFDLRPAPGANDRERLRAALLERARSQSSEVDLSGLVPSDTGRSRFSVADLFINLVRLPRTATDPPPPLTRLLVLGQPGSGKTLFLRQLALDYATGGGDLLRLGPSPAPLPLFASLPAYARARELRSAALGLDDHIRDLLVEEGHPSAGALPEVWPDLLLLLDGLDEVRTVEERRAVMKEVARVASTCRAVVVTGRSIVLEDLTDELLRPFQRARPSPPNTQQVREILLRFFRARRQPDPDKAAREAVEGIERSPDLGALSRVPLLLVLLGILHDQDGRFPERRSAIYHRVTELLLDRWERARARARGSTVSRAQGLGDTLRVVGTLAWWLLEKGQFEATDEELFTELRRIEVARGESDEDAGRRATALVELLRNQSALLVHAGPHRWRFVHATLGEYLAGVDLARGGPRWKVVLQDLFRVDWFEVVAFAAGELGRRADDERIAELVRSALYRRKGRYPATYALLIGSILEEDPGMPPSAQRSLVDRLLELSWDKVYYSRSVEAVAQNLVKLVIIHGERSWGEHFANSLMDRLLRPGPNGWSDQHQSLAGVARELCLHLAHPETERVRWYMDGSESEAVRLAALRWKIQDAGPDEREAIVAEGLRRHPKLNRYQLTGDLSDVRKDPAYGWTPNEPSSDIEPKYLPF